MMRNILNSILFLVPNAKFTIRSEMTDSDVIAAKNCNETVYPIDDLFVLWSSLNDSPFPGVEAIKSVNQSDSDAVEVRMRKMVRNEDMKTNLSVVAHYKDAKKSNPDLKFSEYLDSLEAEANAIDISI